MAILISSGIFLLMLVSNSPDDLLSEFHPPAPVVAAGVGRGLGFALPGDDGAGFFARNDG